MNKRNITNHKTLENKKNIRSFIFQRIRTLLLTVFKNDTVQASLIFLLLIGIFFSPALVHGKIPYNADYLLRWEPWIINRTEETQFNLVLSDQIDHVLPSQEFIRDSIVDDDYPFWNPNINTGTPFGSVMFTDAFSIVTPIKLLLGSMWGHFAYMVLKLFIPAIFMYKFLRKIKLDKIPSILGSLVLVFSSYSIVNLAVHVSDAFLFVPAILYTGECFLEKPKSYYLLGQIAVLVALLLLSGFPSVIFYYLVILVLYFILRVLIGNREQPIKHRIALLVGIGIAFNLGLALSLFSLLPTYSLLCEYSLEYRSGHAHWHTDINHIYKLIQPSFCGDILSGTWWCNSNANETAIYVGILPILLLPASLMNRKFRFWSIFALLIMVSTILIIFDIGPFLEIISSLPIFNFNPSTRLIALLPFGFAITSAIGLNSILQKIHSKKMVLFIFTTLFAGYLFLTFKIWHFPSLHATLELHYDYFFKQFFTSTLFGLAFFSLIGLAIIQKSVIKKVWIVAIIAILAFWELFMNLSTYNSSFEPNTFFAETEGITFLKNEQHNYERFIPLGRNILPHTYLYYGINGLVGHWWGSTTFKDTMNLVDPSLYPSYSITQPFFKSETIDHGSTLLDLFRVKHVVTGAYEPPVWQRIYSYQNGFNANIPLKSNDIITQDITISRKGSIDTFEIRISSPAAEVSSTVFLTVSNSENNVLATATSTLVPNSKGYVEFFINPVNVKEGDLLSFTIQSSEGFPANTSLLYVSGADLYKGGILSINENNIQGDSTFFLTGFDEKLKEKYTLVYEKEIKIYERKNQESVPVVQSFVTSTIENCPAILSEIDPLTEAVLTDGIPKKLASNGTTPQTGNSQAAITRYTNTEVQIDVETTTGGLVVLGDYYHPGWKASVDGVTTDIIRTNCIMRGIIVPEGNHSIILKYHDEYFTKGLAISLISLGGIILISSMPYILDKTRQTFLRYKQTVMKNRSTT